MKERPPSLSRFAAVFLIGGVLASAAAGLSFQAFFPLGPALQSRSYLPEAFVVMILVMFPCGGFVADRFLRSRSLSDLIPCVLGTYITVVGVSLAAGLRFGELVPPICFSTAGMIASAAGAFMMSRRVLPTSY